MELNTNVDVQLNKTTYVLLGVTLLIVVAMAIFLTQLARK